MGYRRDTLSFIDAPGHAAGTTFALMVSWRTRGALGTSVSAALGGWLGIDFRVGYKEGARGLLGMNVWSI